MTATIVLPELQEGKKVVLFFSGGINSTLLAYLAKQKYGADNIIPLFNGFTPVRKVEDVTLSDAVRAKARRVLSNRISSYTKMCDILELQNRVVLETMAQYNYGNSNLIRDIHRTNVGDAMLTILDEQFNIDPSTIQWVIMGEEKLDYEICMLNELDAADGVIFNIDAAAVAAHVQANPELFPEVIKHNITSRWAEWSQSNGFYLLDDNQYDSVRGVVGVMPLIEISKTEIVQTYYDLGLQDLLEQTISCHNGAQYPTPCGGCIPCTERNLALDYVSANTQTASP